MLDFKDAFVTGCDRHQEWMLVWFLRNYRKHNTTPIVFADFGVSDEIKHWVKINFDDYIPIPRYPLNGPAWFLKPLSLIETPSRRKCWIDTDCEVLGDISGIFSHVRPKMLSICRDMPWSIRRKEIWHNTGVVACIDNPTILYNWHDNCRVNTDSIRGDQEILHAMMTDPLQVNMFINDLPNKYNWLRLQILDGYDDPHKLIMHHTGPVGKDTIRRLL